MRRSNHLFLGLTAISLVTMTAGCQGIMPPGPMDYQQSGAVIHDPFPQDDIAPSDPSARPPDYARPLPEPVRTRLIPDAMPQLGR